MSPTHPLDWLVESEALPLIEFLTDNGYPLTAKPLTYAISRGILNAAVYFVNIGVQLPSGALAMAIRSQSHDLIRYLLASGVNIDNYSLRAATSTLEPEFIKTMIKYGANFEEELATCVLEDSKDAISVLLDAGVPISEHVIDVALKVGNTDIIRDYIRQRGARNSVGYKLLETAIKKEYVNGVRSLEYLGYRPTRKHIELAVKSRTLIGLMKVIKIDKNLIRSMMLDVIREDNVEDLDYLVRFYGDITFDMIEQAKSCKSKKILKRFKRYGYIKSDDKCCIQ